MKLCAIGKGEHPEAKRASRLSEASQINGNYHRAAKTLSARGRVYTRDACADDSCRRVCVG